MLKFQQQFANFMVRTGQDVPQFPTEPAVPVAILRVKLIAEELSELADALGLKMEFKKHERGFFLSVDGPSGEDVDLVLAEYAMADIAYSANIGTAVATGIDLEPVMEEVHEANMTKFIDGHCADGKWIKGSSSYTRGFLKGERATTLALGKLAMGKGNPKLSNCCGAPPQGETSRGRKINCPDQRSC